MLGWKIPHRGDGVRGERAGKKGERTEKAGQDGTGHRTHAHKRQPSDKQTNKRMNRYPSPNTITLATYKAINSPTHTQDSRTIDPGGRYIFGCPSLDLRGLPVGTANGELGVGHWILPNSPSRRTMQDLLYLHVLKF